MILPDDQLKEIIVRSGVVTPEVLAQVESDMEGAHISLGGQLIAQHILSDEQLGTILAEAVKVPFVTLTKLTIDQAAFTIVPPRIIDTRW